MTRRIILLLLVVAACKSSTAGSSASIRCGDETSNTSITCLTGKAVCRCMGPYAECECK